MVYVRRAIATALFCVGFGASSSDIAGLQAEESQQSASVVSTESIKHIPQSSREVQEEPGRELNGKRNYLQYFYQGSPVAPPIPYSYNSAPTYGGYYDGYGYYGKKESSYGKKGKKYGGGKKGYAMAPAGGSKGPAHVECSEHIPCHYPGQVCDTGRCVMEGILRFTLRWEGDDDLDLVVTTPNGFPLAFGNSPDPETGGIFEIDDVGSGRNQNYYVENVYFPLIANAAINGTYILSVSPFTSGPEDDYFSIATYLNGILRSEYFGVFRAVHGHMVQAAQLFEFTVF